ncbi:MAG: helix-turn-helix domain-containing protein [Rhizobiaceae bacterium]
MTRKPLWDKHSIKAEIHRRGQTLNGLGAKFGLNAGDISKALSCRFPSAELVICQFLQVPINQLWPDRYDSDGYPIRYIHRPSAGMPMSKAARNRVNQANSRHADLKVVA